MFLVDDILLAPVHGLLWVFKEIRHAVEEERANEGEAITAKLGELYMMLETGQMTEAEFDAAETLLLDRLDAIREGAAGDKDEDEDEDEDDVEEDEDEEDNDEGLGEERPGR